ncbi:RrF2 family transcriptional regulator [Pacificispira sp.]|uniref:RrF2 family transcriptional regulator n=1 Tax=Pacificispira sp. TaxID=2888761 RepID=UPI003BAB07F4
MILRNQVEWALHCCSILAGLPEGRFISTKILAEFHGVPKEYLSKALQSLSQAGLVETTLGPRGGYRLARPAGEITFLDIVEAVEGKEPTFRCSEIRGNNPCLPKGYCSPDKCAIARIMWQADQAWRQSLRETSLADLFDLLGRELDPEIFKATAAWLMARTGGGD